MPNAISNFFKGNSTPTPVADPVVAPADVVVTPNPGESVTSENSSSLDSYTGLWDTAPKSEEAPNASLNSLLTIDPAKIQEASANIDFSQVVTPEDLTAIGNGGEGAQQAFLSAINKMGQSIFSQSMIANANLTQQAFNKSDEIIDQKTVQNSRQVEVSKHILEADTSVLSHPAVSPVVAALQSTVQQRFPNESPQEVGSKVLGYLDAFATALTAQPEPTAEEKGGTNWLDYVDLPPLPKK